MKERTHGPNCTVSQFAMIAALRPLNENKHVYFASTASQYSAKPFCVFSRKLDMSQFTPADPEKSILKKSISSIDTLPVQPKPEKQKRYSLFPRFFSFISLIFMVIFYQLRKWKSLYTGISSFLSHIFMFVKFICLSFSTHNHIKTDHVHNTVADYSLPINPPPVISIETTHSI